MLKSQLKSTDTYSDQSYIQDQIVLKIETADQQWAHLFLNSQNSDLIIKHRLLVYPGHRNIIFKNIALHALELQAEEGFLQIPQNLNPQLVQGVLSCLYSLQLKICRSQALQILVIVHCLHISQLKRQVQDDIRANMQDYDIFPLLQKSIDFDMQQLKNLCICILQSQSYEQMRYGKFDLLSCSEQTLKFVVVHHNQRRLQQSTFGLREKQVQQLIVQYCKHNNYCQKAKNQLMKYLNQWALKSQSPSFNKTKLKLKDKLDNYIQNQSLLQIRLQTPRAFFKETSISFKSFSYPTFPQLVRSRTKSMMLDLTYMGRQRKKSSRGSESSNSQSTIFSGIISLKELNKNMQNQIQELAETIQKLEKSMKQKESQHRNITFKVEEVESLLEESWNQLMQQNKQLLLLDTKLGKIIMNQINENGGVFYSQFDSFRDINSSSQSQDHRAVQKYQEKSQNKKDENLRVSLIQSKWVCC